MARTRARIWYLVAGIALVIAVLVHARKQFTFREDLLASDDTGTSSGTTTNSDSTLPTLELTPAPLTLEPPRTLPPRTLPPVKQISGSADGVIVDYLTERFALGYGRAIRVCENLTNAPSNPSSNPPSNAASAGSPDVGVPSSMAQLNSALRASAGGSGSGPTGPTDNPFVESALIPIATALEMPSLGQLVQLIQSARTMQDPAIVGDDRFRATLSLAAAEAIANRAELSRRAQHAYHLFVLSRVARLQPQLASSSALLSICAHEQVAATTGVAPQLDIDKAAMLRLLASIGLSPDQVGYDPNLVNEVIVTVSQRGVVVTVPWLSHQLGSAFRIDNPFPPQ